jgi:hypothetical protein
LFFYGCKNNTPANPSGPISKYGSLTMQVGDNIYEDTANAIVDRVDNEIMITSTFSPPSYDRIIVKVNGSTTGSYLSSAANNLSYIKYIVDSTEYVSTNSTSGGTITIANIDTVNWKVSGTFSGIVTDAKGNSLVISSAQFFSIDYHEPVGGGGTPNIVRTMTVDINGNSFTPGSISVATSGGKIVIQGYNNTSNLVLQFPLVSPGTYSFSKSSGIQGEYNNNVADTGKLTITSHDYVHNTIVGSYYFTTTNGIVVSNGNFSIVY